MSSETIHFLRRLLLLVIVIGSATGLRGAEEALVLPSDTITRDYLVQNWQSDEGLPRNTINSITQDGKGYLWMGTRHGLIRFDGVRFVALEHKASPALAQGQVFDVFCDRLGALWIATRRSGLLRYAEGEFSSVNSKDLPPNGSVDSIAQGSNGDLWVTKGNGLLGKLASGSFVPTAPLGDIARGTMLFKLMADAEGRLWFFRQDTYGQLVEGHPTNYIRYPDSVITLAPSRDGGIWISTGLDLRHVASGQTSTEEKVMDLPFGAFGVRALCEDRSGALWLGTSRNGLFRLKHGKLERLEGIHHEILDIVEDREGNLWVGTDGAGLYKIRPRVFHVIGEKEGLPKDTIVSVCEDWVAPSGGGVGKIVSPDRVEMLSEFRQNGVRSLMEDGSGGVWLGTAGGRLIHRTANGQRQAAVQIWPNGPQLRVMHRDRKGNLWMGGFPAGLFRLPAGEERRWRDVSWQGFTNVAVTAIAEDAAGMVWIGTSAGELHRWQEGGFQKFGANAGFSRFPVGALLPTSDGALWIGTLGGGLGLFQDGKVQFLGERAGLIDNVITQLIEDGAGWMWVGSSRGISRVLPAELRAVLEGRKPKAAAVHFGSADGLANVQCTAEHQPSVWMTQEGQLRFATSKGVVAFDPAAIPMNMQPPPLTLESVRVDGVSLSKTSEFRIPHDYRKLEFEYAALSFAAPDKVLFKRRLLGFDEDWVEGGTARVATYPRLPPGRYGFQFTACNNDGVWNDESFWLAFEVIPAFWQTAWFRAAMAFLFAGAVGGAVLVLTRVRMRRKLARLEQVNALERERTRISRDLHDDLGARLTQMALLTDLAAEDPAATTDLRGQIKEVSGQARHAVQSLDETVWMINPQKDTLVHVIGYVARYAEQFFQPTPITCLQEICRQPPECMMPGKLRRDILMLVKEALNNVLKHSQASEVRLRISVRGGVMQITVRDNGRGFAAGAPAAQRHGMDSMLRRAENAGIRVTVRSQPGRGTLVALRVRLRWQTNRRGAQRIDAGPGTGQD